MYEMSMESAAKWIATHHMEFICKFSMVSVIKDWSATAIVEYMPVAFNPGVPAELRAIELRSKLPPNSLVSAHWIKPIQHHMEGQRLAHVIARFTSPEMANACIRDGILIEGRMGQTHKKGPL